MKQFRIFVFTFVFFTFNSVCFSAFQYLEVGARPLGMAGAYSCIGDDANAPAWNPAGLAKIQKFEITNMYSVFYPDLIDDLGLSYISAAYPLKKYGSAGISIIEMSAGFYKENVFCLTYANILPFYEKIAIGINIKNMAKKYSETGYTHLDPTFANGTGAAGYGLDLGMTYKINQRFTCAVTGKNLNEPNIKLVKNDVVPAEYRFGAAHKYNQYVTLTCDLAAYNKGLNNIFCFGAEGWVPGNRLGVRAGYSVGDNEYKIMAMGASYKVPLKNAVLQLDYGYVNNLSFSQSPGNHYFSIGVKF